MACTPTPRLRMGSPHCPPQPDSVQPPRVACHRPQHLQTPVSASRRTRPRSRPYSSPPGRLRAVLVNSIQEGQEGQQRQGSVLAPWSPGVYGCSSPPMQRSGIPAGPRPSPEPVPPRASPRIAQDVICCSPVPSGGVDVSSRCSFGTVLCSIPACSAARPCLQPVINRNPSWTHHPLSRRLPSAAPRAGYIRLIQHRKKCSFSKQKGR